MSVAVAQSPMSTGRRRRLRRSDCSGPGVRRVRRGRGFSYVGPDGRRVDDEPTLERIRALAIPPAWEDVWICTDELGHLQATGRDAAGRKQYLYHELWRQQRDREKFEHMVEFAQALPRLRRRVDNDLDGTQLSRERVLACAVRLLDVGLFRVGGEDYADEEGGIGLATFEKRHVRVSDGTMVFDYLAKAGIHRVQQVVDADAGAVVVALKRRRTGGDHLLAYKHGRRWTQLRSEDINEYIKAHLDASSSAKDFRTWNATVVAAVALAARGDVAATKGARKRAIDAAVRQVSQLLGNTPAVARRSYIDPRVFDRYLAGSTVELSGIDPELVVGCGDGARRRVERAVLALLRD
jgi:DNA topoisomerase IB